jgi:uncharacterized membrane protein YfcA
MGMQEIHAMNALKVILGGSINAVAAITFALKGAVVWPQACVMICGAIVGGYGGAYYARQIAPSSVRAGVIVIAFTMTAYFFVKTYVHV